MSQPGETLYTNGLHQSHALLETAPVNLEVKQRGRGLSAGNARTVNPQRYLHAASPRDFTPAEHYYNDAQLGDRGLFRRPSLGFSNSAQSSSEHHVLPRSNSYATLKSVSTLKLPSRVATQSDRPPMVDEGWLPKSRAADQTSGGNQIPGSSPMIRIPSTPATAPIDRNAVEDTRRQDRMHSGKIKRDVHLRSQSRAANPQQVEYKSVSDYALHHLFNSFVRDADIKTNQCVVSSLGQPEPDIEMICGPGIDPNFDQLVSALGHIARLQPKFLIRSLFEWRRKLNELTRDKPDTSGQLETILVNQNAQIARLDPNGQRSPAPAYDSEAVASERRENVANYLFCRILLETLSQSNLAAITVHLVDYLEDIIYKSLKSFTQEILDKSPIARGNWKLYGQLIGVLSELHFDGLASRFLMDLETWQKVLGEKSYTDRNVEAESVLIMKAMRHLRLRQTSSEAFIESCNFVQAVAQFFGSVHGQAPKYAYCRLLEAQLLPVAAKMTKELNDPAWRRVVRVINDRVSQFASKPKYWQAAASLQTVLMCASPYDIFTTKWASLLPNLQSKLREARSRSTALKLICRLVWSYLQTTTDTQAVIASTLEDIIKPVFFSGRRFPLSTEPGISEPLIQLIRIIGFKNQTFCFKSIIFPLINSELFSSGRELKIEQLDPARMVIGIKAFLAIMGDLERRELPPFPIKFADESTEDAQSRNSLVMNWKDKSQKRKHSTVKEDRLSRPVMTTNFMEITKDHYNKFCGILGKITIICDNAFGGQAVLDREFATTTPKTPVTDAFAFNRRDDHVGLDEQRQGFYDLLHVAVQALPRFMSADIPFNSLVNLLCTGTAHMEKHIASSSAQSLKSIARQAHAQQVTLGFARFIFKYDNRYSTMSDGGMLGPNHIDSTLNLYVELLKIWIEEIQEKTKKTNLDQANDQQGNGRGPQLDLSGIWAHVDEIESHGLFFLCSPSRRVRAIAIDVLGLVTKFDDALGKSNTRIVRILEGSTQTVIDVNDQSLSIAEKSRLQRGMRKSNVQSTFVELCSSEATHDLLLWYRIFPNLVQTSFEICPHAVILTRSIICERLSQLQPVLESMDGRLRMHQNSSVDLTIPRGTSRFSNSANDMIIEQWKLYLVFACSTLTKTGSQQSTNGTDANHARKTSKSSQHSADKIESASDLFAKVIPMLSSDNSALRHAAVCGLGSININLYKPLLEALDRSATGLFTTSHSSTGSPARYRSRDHLRTEITHVYKRTSHFLSESEAARDQWSLNMLVAYTNDLRLFLGDTEFQKEWAFHKLRLHYCGLVDGLFQGINKTEEPLRWMSFQTRKAAFALLEGWSGFAPDSSLGRRDEVSGDVSPSPERPFENSIFRVNAQMERDKQDLKTAALGAMATLCRGPVRITTGNNKSIQFDVGRMLSWIDMIFNTESDKPHTIGRRALKNLITFNREHSVLVDRSIDMIYRTAKSKGIESYLEVVCEVLSIPDFPPPPYWKIIAAGLYLLGDGQSTNRIKAARLLRSFAEHQGKAKLQDLDISISDKTSAVFNKAQFEMSQKLAQQHQDLAFHVFSEFSRFFKDLHPDRQRVMVPAMLPWAQIVELQINPDGKPTAYSQMFLTNLFEITIKCSNTLPHEVLALWKALAAGPYAGNVQLILNFIIELCLESKDQNFVESSKQIIVFLSDETTVPLPDRSNSRRQRIVEFLLLNINPQALVNIGDQRGTPVSPEYASLPYVADLSGLMTAGSRQSPLSLGQLCMIFLVDLVVAPVHLASDKVPVLLQIVFVLWDHHTILVQDQAREMLVHLIHELIISKLDESASDHMKSSADELVELIRRHDPKVVWNYEENIASPHEKSTPGVPDTMTYVVSEVIKLFSVIHPTIRDIWGRTAMSWATNCAVHHSACRSFQLFRCILRPLDEQILCDMLSRLAATAGDDHDVVQVYTVEMLRALGSFIDALDINDLQRFPQIFWTVCAAMDSPNEFEFRETINILERLLDKWSLEESNVRQILSCSAPPEWDGHFDGLATPIYKGCKSSICLDQSLRILDRLVSIPKDVLVGSNERLLFTFLANVPRLLHSFENPEIQGECGAVASKLAKVAEMHAYPDLSRVLNDLASLRFRESRDFLFQSMAAIKSSFFPDYEFESLTFLIGLLTNDTPWFKIEVMQTLSVLAPDVDLRKPKIVDQGPDLLSPLFRLLSTEYARQALKVLDNIKTMMQGTPLDDQYMRMSIAGSDSSRAFRKEHEKTRSLYGIPERNGWSIPMPAIEKERTRSNLRRIHSALSKTAATGLAIVTDPGVEFYKEEAQYPSPYAYDRTATMTSDDLTLADSGYGELASKLDSLDDFFDDASPDELPIQSYHQIYDKPFQSAASIRENVYDRQTAPILHKTMARNASISSLQGGFVDGRPTTREPVVMSPSAFTPASNVFTRPGMAPRSATLPVVHSQQRVLADLSTDEHFSDDDDPLSRTSTGDHSLAGDHIVRTLPKSRPSFRSGVRSGIKRLTSTDRYRSKMEDSPEVPKVPEVYLQNPRSSEL